MIVVAFHLPTVDNQGSPVEVWKIERLMTQLIDKYGGVSVFRGEGAWRSPDSYLYQEPILRVLIGIPEDEVEPFVETIDKRLKDEFQQESVWLEVDGKPSIR